MDEGLPKQRAEVKNEIRLRTAIRDAAVRQGVAAEQKINLMQKGDRDWQVSDGRGSMVNDLTVEIEDRAQVEALPTRSSQI
jgi:hypothetical protein